MASTLPPPAPCPSCGGSLQYPREGAVVRADAHGHGYDADDFASCPTCEWSGTITEAERQQREMAETTVHYGEQAVLALAMSWRTTGANGDDLWDAVGRLVTAYRHQFMLAGLPEAAWPHDTIGTLMLEFHPADGHPTDGTWTLAGRTGLSHGEAWRLLTEEFHEPAAIADMLLRTAREATR